MNNSERVAKLRRAALLAGFAPTSVEVPIAEIDNTIRSNPWFGLMVSYEAGPLVLLAVPNRRIGCCECVAPTRFYEVEA